MNNVREALSWIINIIQKHNIPFQIAGGLATKAYGSPRKFWDIDIDISETDFDKIKDDVGDYLLAPTYRAINCTK